MRRPPPQARLARRPPSGSSCPAPCPAAAPASGRPLHRLQLVPGQLGEQAARIQAGERIAERQRGHRAHRGARVAPAQRRSRPPPATGTARSGAAAAARRCRSCGRAARRRALPQQRPMHLRKDAKKAWGGELIDAGSGDAVASGAGDAALARLPGRCSPPLARLPRPEIEIAPTASQGRSPIYPRCGTRVGGAAASRRKPCRRRVAARTGNGQRAPAAAGRIQPGSGRHRIQARRSAVARSPPTTAGKPRTPWSRPAPRTPARPTAGAGRRRRSDAASRARAR